MIEQIHLAKTFNLKFFSISFIALQFLKFILIWILILCKIWSPKTVIIIIIVLSISLTFFLKKHLCITMKRLCLSYQGFLFLGLIINFNYFMDLFLIFFFWLLFNFCILFNRFFICFDIRFWQTWRTPTRIRF